MVYVYKNFLIIERNEKMEKAIKLVVHLNSGFDDGNRIWHAKSGFDKIVLVYRHPLIADNEIHSFARYEEIRFSLNEYLGYIHVYCQGTNIKIDKFKINLRLFDQEVLWKTYKQYICAMIRQSGVQPMQLTNTLFTVYWGKLSPGVADFMQRIGLLDDRNKKIYVFKPADLQPTGYAFSNYGGIWNTAAPFNFQMNTQQSMFTK